MPGSEPGSLNWRDVRNSLKHVGLVAVASVLTPLSTGAGLNWSQIKTGLTTSVATGLLTLIARLLQDNQRGACPMREEGV